MQTLKCIPAAARPPMPGTTPASGVVRASPARTAPASDAVGGQSGSDLITHHFFRVGCWTIGCWSFSSSVRLGRSVFYLGLDGVSPHQELIRLSRLFPHLCSLVSIRGLKIFFWKNEAKLCPSLLGFFKKQSQIEPKTNPKKALTNPLKPKK
jgi:hypothetical protein